MMNCRCVNINGKSIDTNQDCTSQIILHSLMPNGVSNFTVYKAYLTSHLTVCYLKYVLFLQLLKTFHKFWQQKFGTVFGSEKSWLSALSQQLI